MYAPDDLRAMVRPDRVHRKLYVDPDIFDLEMDRIYGRSWVFVCHESQVAKPNDFITTRIGRQPLLVTRDRGGELHVLFNRCGHRGVKLCADAEGNRAGFRCPYHGWAYRIDGRLAGIPYRDGYSEDFLKDPDLDLARPARVDSYRGFVFASLSADVPPLDEHLGGIKRSIDDLCDRAPDGEILAQAGCNRYIVRANWKMQMDNGVDLYHAPFAHHSTLDEDGRQFSRHGGGPSFYKPGTRIPVDFDPMGVHGFPNGHGYQGAVPQVPNPDGLAFQELKAMLIAKHGEERTTEILTYDRFNSMIYPNLTFQAMGQHFRVVMPLDVDRTEVRIYPVLMKGAPDDWNRDAVRSVAATHSPASMIQTDDVAVFERAQEGLQASGADWVMFARHMGAEIPNNVGGHGAPGSSEFVLRNQYNDVWLPLMCQ
ncbi:MAG: Rieske 2Fe-2S domain-containing protein [Pseudomonadota bacterium]|nr:Rieske 2Fe-2S domain-containing protein [Pseudomonadota bacterium]